MEAYRYNFNVCYFNCILGMETGVHNFISSRISHQQKFPEWTAYYYPPFHCLYEWHIDGTSRA